MKKKQYINASDRFVTIDTNQEIRSLKTFTVVNQATLLKVRQKIDNVYEMFIAFTDGDDKVYTDVGYHKNTGAYLYNAICKQSVFVGNDGNLYLGTSSSTHIPIINANNLKEYIKPEALK